MTDSVRVRFAPSPTGYLHVGGARTALFNWLFARKHLGTFILRIEDTDAERSTDESTRGIIEAMNWLGLNADEGPLFQSHRIDAHRAAAARLIESGHTYYCFCSPELLERKRQEAAANKTDFKYDRTCLSLPAGEVSRRLAAGEKAAVRFKVPPGAVSFDDAVIGQITIDSAMIEDFVLLRSNSQPTYHVGVVVDDIDMRITHVIRGAEHISNTPKQILLYRALNAPIPVFAHAPMILGPDKTKLSKRHGATSVMAYAEEGILPEALLNFLALLGWSPGNDQELFEIGDLIESFSLPGISKANAVFNPEKLAWFNAQYIQKLPDRKLIEHLRPHFEKAGLWNAAFETERFEWFCTMLAQLRPRSKTLLDFPRQARMFLVEDVEIDPAASAKFLSDAVRQHLATLAGRLEALNDFNLQTTEETTRALAAETGIKPGALMGAVRVALTGQTVSPGLFEVMHILGRDKTVRRLRQVRGAGA